MLPLFSPLLSGFKTSMYLWSLCDVPFEEILPDKCVPYDNDACLELQLFRAHLAQAVVDLKSGYGLTMVYYSNVDEVGHRSGPDSLELREEIRK